MKTNLEDIIWNEPGGVQILGTGDYLIAGIDSTGVMKWGINSTGDVTMVGSFEVETGLIANSQLKYFIDIEEKDRYWTEAIIEENKERCEYCGSWKDMYKSCEKCGAP